MEQCHSYNQQLRELLRSHTINYNGNTYSESKWYADREYEIKTLIKNKEPLRQIIIFYIYSALYIPKLFRI